jgi:WD40 repeat protein
MNEIESNLLNRYISDLLRDPSAVPPDSLRRDLADFARMLVHAERTSLEPMNLRRQTAIWEQIRQSRSAPGAAPNGYHNGYHKEERPMLLTAISVPRHTRRNGQFTALVAGLIVLITAVLILLAAPLQSNPLLLTTIQDATAVPTLAPRELAAMPLYSLPAAWSPDGTRLAVVKEIDVQLYDEDRQLITTLVGHGSLVTGVAWSADGTMLASGGQDGSLRLWSPDGELIRIITGHTGGIDSFSWSPDSKMLVSGAANNDGTLRLWNVDGTGIRTIKAGPEQIDGGNLLRWSPDGTRFSIVYGTSIAEIWSVDGESIGVLNNRMAPVNRVAWSPDGTVLAGTSPNGLFMWNKSGELIIEYSGIQTLMDVYWSPDGRSLTVTSFTRKPYYFTVDIGTGTLQPFGLQGAQDTIATDAAFSPDGRYVAYAYTSAEDTVWVYDVTTWEMFTADVDAELLGGAYLAWKPDDATLDMWQRSFDTPITFNVQESIGSAASVATPEAVAETIPPTTETEQPSAESSRIQLGRIVEGEIPAGQTFTTYSARFEEEQQIFILAQSDDFAINIIPSIICPDGGGGGGGGGNVTGGSPTWYPNTVRVCANGELTLNVTSMTSTESGRFRMGVWALNPEALSEGETVSHEFTAEQPFAAYAVDASLGSLITVNAEGGDLNFADLSTSLTGWSLLRSSSDTHQTYMVRERGFEPSLMLLIVPNGELPTGTLNLSYTVEPPAELNSAAQRVTLTPEQPMQAFRFTSEQPNVVLNFERIEGVTDLQINVIQSVVDRQMPPAPMFTVLPSNQDFSYRLDVMPDTEYVVFVEWTFAFNEPQIVLDVSMR